MVLAVLVSGMGSFCGSELIWGFRGRTLFFGFRRGLI